MPGVFHIIPLLSALLLGPAHAADTVTIGDGDGDSFMLERISPNDNSVVVLLRPKGEDCTFRFAVDVGRSVQLRIAARSVRLFSARRPYDPLWTPRVCNSGPRAPRGRQVPSADVPPEAEPRLRQRPELRVRNF